MGKKRLSWRRRVYYRYAMWGVKTHVLEDDGVHQVWGYKAKLTFLSKTYPAALWDSYHDTQSCCGGQNPAYHREGYNVLYYAGNAKTVPQVFWHPG